MELKDNNNENPVNEPVSNIKLNFVTKEVANLLLLDRNDYYDRMYPYERGLRTGTDKAIDAEAFKKYIVQHTLNWDNDEKVATEKTFKQVFKDISDKKYKMIFPDTIDIIKTDGEEDIRQCSAYCRYNCIIFNPNAFKDNGSPTYHVISHELFHIHSQNDPVKRKQYYKMLGFDTCKDITVPNYLRRSSANESRCDVR